MKRNTSSLTPRLVLARGLPILLTMISMACGDNDFKGSSGATRTAEAHKPGMATNESADAQGKVPGKPHAPSKADIDQTTEQAKVDTNKPQQLDTEEDGCPKTHGNAGVIKIAGKGKDAVMDLGNATRVRITGSENTLTLRLPYQAEAAVASLCVFIAGNTNQVRIEIEGTLTQLHYIGRGDHAQAEVVVASTGKLLAATADLAGNNGKLKIQGSGQYACPSTPKLAGKQPSIDCAQAP